MHRDLLDFKKIKLMTLNILSGGGKRIDKISKKIITKIINKINFSYEYH